MELPVGCRRWRRPASRGWSPLDISAARSVCADEPPDHRRARARPERRPAVGSLDASTRATGDRVAPDARGARRRSRRVAGWRDDRLHDSDGGSAGARDDAVGPGGRSSRTADSISETDVEFAMPRWSPDGRSIAAERRIRGGPAEIVLVDVASKQVRTLASLPGGRSGVAGMDARRRARALLRLRSATSRSGSTGSRWRPGRCRGSKEPAERAVAGRRPPDGRRRGLRRLHRRRLRPLLAALDDARWTPVEASVCAAAERDCRRRESAPSGAAVRPYSPLRTLAPTFWTPTIESDADELVIGAATGSADALGRHAYGIEGGWSVRARPDWQIAYAYDRWRPTLFAAYSDDTDGWREGEVRTREVEMLVLVLPWRRVRSVRSMLASVHVGDDQFDCAACEEPVDACRAPDLRARRRRLQQRAPVRLLNQRRRRRPIDGDRGGLARGGVRGTVVGRRRREPESPLTADARYYRRLGPATTVLAIRAAAAGSWGDDAAAQLFSASGNGPQSGGFGFGLDAIGLLRGFDEDAVVGTRAAVIERRLPSAVVADRPRRRHHSALPAHRPRRRVLRRRPGVDGDCSVARRQRILRRRDLRRHRGWLCAAPYLHGRDRGPAGRFIRRPRCRRLRSGWTGVLRLRDSGGGSRHRNLRNGATERTK